MNYVNIFYVLWDFSCRFTASPFTTPAMSSECRTAVAALRESYRLTYGDVKPKSQQAAYDAFYAHRTLLQAFTAQIMDIVNSGKKALVKVEPDRHHSQTIEILEVKGTAEGHFLEYKNGAGKRAVTARIDLLDVVDIKPEIG